MMKVVLLEHAQARLERGSYLASMIIIDKNFEGNIRNYLACNNHSSLVRMCVEVVDIRAMA